MKNESSISKLLPVLFGFFIMGFVDVVGIAKNYVQQDFSLTNSTASLLTMMVFLWFAVFSVPTSLLMNKIGRKNTVLLSMVITFIAMLVPFISYNFNSVLLAFALLGIGNTILQVSLNPLMTNVVRGDKLTSSLTLGQFIKAIASFVGPIIAGYAASKFGSWKLIFPVFSIVTLISSLWLLLTQIKEEQPSGKTSSFGASFGLLANINILLLFLGIIFVVGVDVGLNTYVPSFLKERCSLPLEKAGLGTSLYFAARTIGAFLGAIILVKFSARKFFIISMSVAIPAIILMILTSQLWAILTLVFILGFACANVFSIIFASAIKLKPESANEISGLMIMGVGGAAVIVPVMGFVSDKSGQTGAMLVLLACLVYLLFCAFRIKKEA